MSIKNLFIAAVMLIAFWLIAATAYAGHPNQGQCASTQEVLKFHEKTYGQKVLFSVPTSIENVSLTVLATPSGLTWAIVTTNSERGRSCFKVDGTNWPVER